MRKILSVILALSIMTSCGAIMASAVQSSSMTDKQIGSTRADPDIDTVSATMSNSDYSAYVTFNKKCSGSLLVKVYKYTGSGWVYDNKQASSTFTNAYSASVSGTGSFNGTYQLWVYVTIGNRTVLIKIDM